MVWLRGCVRPQACPFGERAWPPASQFWALCAAPAELHDRGPGEVERGPLCWSTHSTEEETESRRGGHLATQSVSLYPDRISGNFRVSRWGLGVGAQSQSQESRMEGALEGWDDCQGQGPCDPSEPCLSGKRQGQMMS